LPFIFNLSQRYVFYINIPNIYKESKKIMKFLMSNISLIVENQQIKRPIQILDEIDELASTINDNISKEITIPKDVLNSFKIKDSLNKEIWSDDKLNPKVKTKLLQIAKGFIKDLELPKEIKIKDIIFTGSLANYNWSKFSDIDLHIVIDFNQFDADPNIINDLFYAQKSIWNQQHDITVFDYPVELYVQNINDKLFAEAVYSIPRDKWIKKPKKETFTVNKQAIKNDAEKYIDYLKDIRQDYKDKDYQSVIDKTDKIKAKIKNMRQAGLEKGGEYSKENLVFKILRRTSFMDILNDFKIKAYDNLMSVTENTEKPIRYIPYSDDIEIKTSSSYPSLSKSDFKADINRIKSRMDKASQVANQYKQETGDEAYFTTPYEGEGFYQVEFRHDGQIKTKHVRASGDMEQMTTPFRPTDIGTCNSFQNIARYCFVKAGKRLPNNKFSFGASPAEDAANKALIIFRDEILDFYGDAGYGDEKSAQISKEKMTDKLAQQKLKKDLEAKLGRRLRDDEWFRYLKTKEEPEKKQTVSIDQEKAAEFEKRQQAALARRAAAIARQNKLK